MRPVQMDVWHGTARGRGTAEGRRTAEGRSVRGQRDWPIDTEPGAGRPEAAVPRRLSGVRVTVPEDGVLGSVVVAGWTRFRNLADPKHREPARSSTYCSLFFMSWLRPALAVTEGGVLGRARWRDGCCLALTVSVSVSWRCGHNCLYLYKGFCSPSGGILGNVYGGFGSGKPGQTPCFAGRERRCQSLGERGCQSLAKDGVCQSLAKGGVSPLGERRCQPLEI